MDLGLNTVASTYKYLLIQSGVSPITLGDNSSVSWGNNGLVTTTNLDQVISGVKSFTSNINVSRTVGFTTTPDLYLSNSSYFTKINSNTSSASSPNLLINNGDHSIIYGDAIIDSPSSSMVIGPLSSTTKGIKINSSGMVGIGTNPDHYLHVTGSAKVNILGIGTGAVTGSKLTIVGSNGLLNSAITINANPSSSRASIVLGDWTVGQSFNGDNTKDFFFYGGTSPSNKMSITPQGDVGIGIDSATQKLHVNGNIYASGFTGTYFTGSSFVGNSFSGNSFTGASFSGNSFIGNSFTLQNTGIKLSSPVALTLANTWYDITNLSGTLNSGTWLVNAMALYSGSSSAATSAFRIINSTSGNVYASAMNYHTALVADLSSVHMSTIINQTATTIVKLQAFSSAPSTYIIASGTGIANSGSCSQISFVKIS